MKKILLLVCFLTISLINSTSLTAQCLIDSSQTVPGVYPNVLPDATAGQPYDEDVTFVMITDTLGLTIFNYHIANVVGLPVGLSWQCNNTANGCNYDPAVSLWGCVDISGTPLVPGTYTLTVTVEADVQLVGLQTLPFDVPLVVLPGTVTNPGFSMVNATGCAPLTVDFINNNPGQADYLWDFGNGLQSNLENPPSQQYNTPGTYVVTQTVTPNSTPTWYLTDITVSAIPDNYGGFIDDPDMYFYVYDPQGVQVYDSHPSISDTHPPVSWSLPNLPLQNGTYTIHVWDEDGGLFGADDDLGEITFNGNGTSGTGTGTVSGATGQLIVDYVIFQPPVVPLVATDTVYVFETPAVPTITASGPLAFCEGDSVTLTVSDSINSIQWFESNVILPGETGMNFTPAVSGNYSAVVSSSAGCSSTSLTVAVTISPLPVKPTFFVNGNTFTTTVTGYILQWYLNGVAIPNANGNIFVAQDTGTYTLCATDPLGCENCSDPLLYLGLGISETNTQQFQVYPNPSDGRFTLLFNEAGNDERILKITDITGKQTDRINVSGKGYFVYNKELSSGIYLITVESEKWRYVQKLIVR